MSIAQAHKHACHRLSAEFSSDASSRVEYLSRVREFRFVVYGNILAVHVLCRELFCFIVCLYVSVACNTFPSTTTRTVFSSFFFKLQSERYSGSEEKLSGSGTSFIHAMSTVLFHKTLPMSRSLGRLKRFPTCAKRQTEFFENWCSSIPFSSNYRQV